MKRKNKQIEGGNIETKQMFLSSAISDISSYIHLTDTKVSIIMAIMAALVAIIIEYRTEIISDINNIEICSMPGIMKWIVLIAFMINFFGVFVFGILTIRAHSPKLDYKSKWFISKSVEEYSFEKYKKEFKKMTDDDILDNMTAELYKLNDINRQKLKTYQWVIRCLSLLFITMFILTLLVFIQ